MKFKKSFFHKIHFKFIKEKKEKTILYEIELSNETVKTLKLAWRSNPTEQAYKAYSNISKNKSTFSWGSL